MGDPTIEVTDELREKSQEAKMKASEAAAEGGGVLKAHLRAFPFSRLCVSEMLFD